MIDLDKWILRKGGAPMHLSNESIDLLLPKLYIKIHQNVVANSCGLQSSSLHSHKIGRLQ